MIDSRFAKTYPLRESGSIPDGPIKFAYTWHISAIRCPVIFFITLIFPPFAAMRYILLPYLFLTRSRECRYVFLRPCPMTCKRFSIKIIRKSRRFPNQKIGGISSAIAGGYASYLSVPILKILISHLLPNNTPVGIKGIDLRPKIRAVVGNQQMGQLMHKNIVKPRRRLVYEL